MRTVYHIGERTHVTESSAKSLVSTGFGDFFCLADDLSYQGFFQFHDKPWSIKKSITSLTPLDEGEQHTLHHHFFGLRRAFASGAEDFIIPYQKTLLYQTHQLQGRVLLSFDHRDAYEGSMYGRNYEIIQDETHVLIKFTFGEHTSWTCLKGVHSLESLHNWREVYYEEDARRNAQAKYWVCDVLSFIPQNHVVLATGSTEAEARTRADVTHFHFQDILSQQQEQTLRRAHSLPRCTNEYIQTAYFAAQWSLHQTLQRFSHEHVLVHGIYAGLPWFFQLWSRDELISLRPLITLQKEFPQYTSLLKKIFDRYLAQLHVLGEVPNRFPPTDLASVDALGWLAFQFQNYLESNRHQLFELFSVDALEEWFAGFAKALDHAKKTRGYLFHDAILFTNVSQETWMDTLYQDDGRPGLRIEIQALYSALYSTLCYLAKLLDKREALRKYEKEHKNFQQAVRTLFLHEASPGLILDGITPEGEPDMVARPNVFFAYLLAPKLFLKKTWKAAFDKHLQLLYLDWGGLRTIPQDHPLYCPRYTGQDNRSYHRGDSWYFINALAAQALHRLDASAYKEYVVQIRDACAKDLLELGFAGHASELSSAEVQTGEASPVQSWSAAQFVELVHLFYSR